MADSKNHHFLPQFYLRGFRSSGTGKKSQKVWSISKMPLLECDEELIRNVGSAEHFHSMIRADGSRDSQSVEDQIGKLETIYAPVWKKLATGCPIDAFERHRLSQFICLMEMRTPPAKGQVDRARSGAAEAMNIVLAEGNRLEQSLATLPQTKNWPAPAIAALARHMRTAMTEGRVKFTSSNASLLNLMFRTAFDPRLVGIYDAMNLEILRAPHGQVFVTCDDPVARFDPLSPHPSRPGTGLDSPGVEITFPLSATVLLRFSPSGKGGEREATVVEVREFNRRTIIMAKMFVFASRCDAGILDLVRDNLGNSAGAELQVVPLALGKAMTLSAMIPVRSAEYYAAIASRGEGKGETEGV